jgi:hypothetical protein
MDTTALLSGFRAGGSAAYTAPRSTNSMSTVSNTWLAKPGVL